MNGLFVNIVLISGCIFGLLHTVNDDNSNEVMLCIGIVGVRIVWW